MRETVTTQRPQQQQHTFVTLPVHLEPSANGVVRLEWASSRAFRWRSKNSFTPGCTSSTVITDLLSDMGVGTCAWDGGTGAVAMVRVKDLEECPVSGTNVHALNSSPTRPTRLRNNFTSRFATHVRPRW